MIFWHRTKYQSSPKEKYYLYSSDVLQSKRVQKKKKVKQNRLAEKSVNEHLTRFRSSLRHVLQARN